MILLAMPQSQSISRVLLFVRPNDLVKNEIRNMGGPGSGNWIRTKARTTTSSCLVLDLATLSRDQGLQYGVKGVVTWTWPSGSIAARVAYRILREDTVPTAVELSYIWNNEKPVSHLIGLQTSQLYSGGRRWWMCCPLERDGVPCGKRIAKLYLKGPYFGCRTCHDLTYQSCRESHIEQRLSDRADRLFSPMSIATDLASLIDRF